nr:MAG: putative RNA-dependent RNA polymerase [Narnaviridae sp.]
MIRTRTSRSIQARFKAWKNAPKDSELRKELPTEGDFLAKYNLWYLLRIGTDYPLKFQHFRKFVHCLRFSWAIFLTLKMFRLDSGKTAFAPQRGRHRIFSWSQTNLFSRIFLHLYKAIDDHLNEKSIIKLIKNSICHMFSVAAEQEELPSGEVIPVLPETTYKLIRSELTKEEWVRFAFSILQSKALCEEVPDDFVLDALREHREQLSSEHPGVSKPAMEDLRERGRAFGKLVRRFYRPDKGFFPTNKATFAFPRNKGGVKGDLVFHDRIRVEASPFIPMDPNDRIEPFVIGLFGQPGSGKSSRIPDLLHQLSSLFPKLKGEDLVYQRTCHVEHWDGYRGQPITIFDDLGQSTSGDDIREFQTLVSSCPYVLPMAELSEKGTMFSSSIIIATSNLIYGQPLSRIFPNGSPIIDDASFWRRFHIPLLSEGGLHPLKEPPNWVSPQKMFLQNNYPCPLNRKRDPRMYFQQVDLFKGDRESNIWSSDQFDTSVLTSIYRERMRFHQNICKTWNQEVLHGSNYSTREELLKLLSPAERTMIPESLGRRTGEELHSTSYLSFPARPPTGLLPVRVEPIREPLKVRTITAGKGDTFCLKPLQRAMWLALGQEPQFCLTHGTNRLESAIERIFNQSHENDVWISGDYKGATDSFAIEASRALLEGILESIDHEPTKRWALKEISPHLLVYPDKSGLEPVEQKSGQLMGSLLSFPLLCLLNDCTARACGLKPNQYLINGDDILMRAPSSIYSTWKERVTDYGLKLSLGKNYVHSRFGTVNSQLIIDGRVVSTGKQLVADRKAKILGECLRDLELFMDETPSDCVQSLFVSLNRELLSHTIRDVGVPRSHGGLGFSWNYVKLQDPRSGRIAKMVYLHDLIGKIEPAKGCISLPYFSVEAFGNRYLEEEMETFLNPVKEEPYSEDFLSFGKLRRSGITQGKILNNPKLRNIFEKPLFELPALSFLRTVDIPCSHRELRESTNTKIREKFFQNILDVGGTFDYDTYRKQVISSTIDLQCKGPELKKVVDFVDLHLPRDFLSYIELDSLPKGFTREEFEYKLLRGEQLTPKLFKVETDIPGPDFNLEREYSLLLNEIRSLLCTTMN